MIKGMKRNWQNTYALLVRAPRRKLNPQLGLPDRIYVQMMICIYQENNCSYEHNYAYDETVMINYVNSQ